MSYDDDIIIEDKYGVGRNINDFLDTNHPDLKEDVNLVKNDIPHNNIVEERKEDLISEDFIKTENDKIIINNLEPIENKIESKIESQITNVNKNKQLTIKWYIKNSILGIFFIFIFSVVSLLLIKNSNTSFLDTLRMPFEILVFLVISFFVIKRKKQFPKISGITCLFAGLFSGIFISVFKLFYHMQLWTIFNLATETFFLALLGFISGLIFGALFYSVDESLKNSINK